ncbi:MAG: response regulator transcription factor [Actinomycetota bacterium]
MMRRPYTVVVADDHPIVIAGMRLLLSGSRFFELVGEAQSGAEAILRCEQLRPNILLLDLRLPDLPAATICERIRARHPQLAIVILTAYPEERAIRGCLKAGASGCLFKDVGEQYLLATLRQVLHGRMVIDPRVAGAIMPRWQRSPGGGDGALSEREHEVLEGIARGLSTQEIAGELGLSVNTVKSHTRSVFTKLGAHNRVQAVAAARERSLL